MDTQIQDRDTFAATVGQGVTLVDFWAEWCGPCRMQGQILHDVEKQLPANSRVVKINVDEQPDLASEFGIRSIPTLLLFKEGDVVKNWVGVQTAATLVEAIRRVS